MNNFIVYDFETSGRSSRFDQILQAGIIIYDQNLKALKKLNLKSRINPDIVPSINALRVNKLKISDHEYFKEIKDLKVSSHLYIKRDGEIIQFVPFDKRAWHAGEWSFNGEFDCNDFSIGIELEGSDCDKFTDHQYQVLIDVTKQLMKKYPDIKKNSIYYGFCFGRQVLDCFKKH